MTGSAQNANRERINSIKHRFLNAIREKAFRNPAEPDGFLSKT